MNDDQNLWPTDKVETMFKLLVTELNYVFKANHLGIVVNRSVCYFLWKERKRDRERDRNTERQRERVRQSSSQNSITSSKLTISELLSTGLCVTFYKKKERETERDRERQRETERDIERLRENETELNYVFKANHLGIFVNRSVCYFLWKERKRDRERDRNTERQRERQSSSQN